MANDKNVSWNIKKICSDPFNKHKKRVYKSVKAVATEQVKFYEEFKGVRLLRGNALCTNCKIRLNKMPILPEFANVDTCDVEVKKEVLESIPPTPIKPIEEVLVYEDAYARFLKDQTRDQNYSGITYVPEPEPRCLSPPVKHKKGVKIHHNTRVVIYNVYKHFCGDITDSSVSSLIRKVSEATGVSKGGVASIIREFKK